MNSRTVPDDPVTRGDTFLKKLLPIAFHAKIVRHREHAAHRIGVDPSLLLVALSGNYPLERHLTVSYDDVNRGDSLHGITVQARFAKNSSIRGHANSVVHRREWQDLDLIIDASYTFNALHYGFSIALERRPRHLTGQADFRRPRGSPDCRRLRSTAA